MDDFREWLSDNLRYILLGLAVIVVVVVGIFAAKFISRLATDGIDVTESEMTTDDATADTESESGGTETTNNLVENDPTILETVQAYYTARSNKDIDTLSTMVENLSEEDKQKITNNNVIESYNNIATYSKDGPEEGTYVVYTYYEAKVTDVETLAPGLVCLYLCTDENGSLYIGDKNSNTEVADYITAMNSDEDVKALSQSVDEKYNQVLESDEALRNMMADIGTGETEVVLPDSSDVDVQTNKIVQANDECNIRADSTEDSEIIGTLPQGETATQVQKLDNGWSEIKYLDISGYIRSDLLTEVTTESTESTEAAE